MKTRAIATSVVAALLMTAGVASAAPAKASGKAAPASAGAKIDPTNISGKILRVDPANQTVTLDGGQYYMVPAAIKLDGFKTGDQITMSVEKDQYGIYTVKTIAEAGAKKG